MSFLSHFIPRSTDFFALLKKQAQISIDASDLLYSVSYSHPDAERAMQQLTRFEDAADELTRHIAKEISLTFITPIDRDDLLIINAGQEKIINGMHTVGRQMFMDNFSRCRFPAEKIIQNMTYMTRNIATMLDLLAQKQPLDKPMRELKSLRDACDVQADIGIVEFLDKEVPGLDRVRDLILWTRRYDKLRKTVNMLTGFADLLEQVSLKYV